MISTGLSFLAFCTGESFVPTKEHFWTHDIVSSLFIPGHAEDGQESAQGNLGHLVCPFGEATKQDPTCGRPAELSPQAPLPETSHPQGHLKPFAFIEGQARDATLGPELPTRGGQPLAHISSALHRPPG